MPPVLLAMVMPDEGRAGASSTRNWAPWFSVLWVNAKLVMAEPVMAATTYGVSVEKKLSSTETLHEQPPTTPDSMSMAVAPTWRNVFPVMLTRLTHSGVMP